MEQDIRWLQRYENYHKAAQRVFEVTESGRTADDLSELEAEGLIQRFEYTFELAWKVLQDLLKYKGYEFLQGPNGTLRQAFEDGLLEDHDGWRRMAQARVTTVHVYNENEATEMVRKIFETFSPLLKDLGLLYKVDLVDYHKNAGRPIADHIDRVGQTFYRKENATSFCYKTN